jgi:hypothetical protein
MTASRVCVLAVVCQCALVTSGAAQRWEVSVSGARVSVDTAAAVSSGSVASAFEWRGRSVFMAATGGISAFDVGDWSAQVSADASYFVTRSGVTNGLAGELIAAAAGAHHSSGYQTAAGRVEPRAHFVFGRAGGWLGATATAGWNSVDASMVHGIGPTGGAWIRRGPVRGLATYSLLRLDGAWFSEINSYIAITAGPIDAVGYLGGRGPSAVRGAGGWAGLTASWWVTPRAAVTLAGGSYAPDLLQGLSGGSYLTVGFRLASFRPTIPVLRPVGRPVYEREGEGRIRLRFHIPDATTVAVAGDWTDWQRVPMQPVGDGTWELVMTVSSGVHRFNLVVDGERWIVPEGVPVVGDGFGGQTGLLVVP